MPIGNRGNGRRRVGGWCLGFGMTAFMSQGLLVVTRMFGTMRDVPRPAQGFVHTLTDHGDVFYVSAGTALMQAAIIPFWLLMMVGVVLVPKQPGNRRKLDDPFRIARRWMWLGAISALIFRLCATPIADLLALR